MTALGGAVAGAKLGAKRAEKAERLPAVMKRAVLWTFAISLAVAVVGSIVFAYVAVMVPDIGNFDGFLAVVGLAPFMIVLPVVATTVLAPPIVGAFARRTYRRARESLIAHKPAPDEGVFRTPAVGPEAPRLFERKLAGVITICPACRHGLPDGEIVRDCPKCNAPLARPKLPIVAQGIRYAWSTAATAFGLSLVLTIVGYVAMWILFALFSLGK